MTHGIFLPSNPRAFVGFGALIVAFVVGDASTSTHRSRANDESLGALARVIRRGSPWWGHDDESRIVDWTDFVRCHVWLGDTPRLFTHVHVIFLWIDDDSLPTDTTDTRTDISSPVPLAFRS